MKAQTVPGDSSQTFIGDKLPTSGARVICHKVIGNFAVRTALRECPLYLMLVITICFISTQALAQQKEKPQVDISEANIDDLMKMKVGSVYGASQFNQKITDAPSSVSIITSADIRK